jgi:hypothetical protein
MDASTVTTIMNNINTLYSNALGQLITFTIGILAFVGVLLPLIISFLQNRQLKADHKNLNEKISLDIQAAKIVLNKDIKNEIVKEIEEFKEEILKLQQEMNKENIRKMTVIEAKTYHVQAVTQILSRDYPTAFQDLMTAIVSYVEADDELNVQAALNDSNMHDLPHLKKIDFEHNIEI